MNQNTVKRKVSVFEILLLIVGIAIVAAGTIILNTLISEGYPVLDIITFVSLWFILIFMIVIAAIAENAREELGIIVQENSNEIKILREISREHLDEIKLLRESLSSKSKGKK